MTKERFLAVGGWPVSAKVIRELTEETRGSSGMVETGRGKTNKSSENNKQSVGQVGQRKEQSLMGVNEKQTYT